MNFINRYPFIDNQLVVGNLSAAVKKKYNEVKQVDGSALVSLTVEEVQGILAQANLTQEQTNQVMSDLL